MVITGDRQHMLAINNADYLKYMMCFDANGARAWTVEDDRHSTSCGQH